MKNKWFLLAVAVFPVFFSGCGLSIYEDWKKSGGKAIAGAGAIAGKDYVTGLKPSENSRKYFARISGDNRPVETVSRSDEGESKSGVKFVKNGGILIPPGVTISFENKGYCMDPNLPAPKAGEEYQLVPMAQLIPEDLQGIYKNLVTKAAAGDESVQRNMQHLVWALRTAGTDAAFANNLTKEQKRILDRCSEYPGQFEEFNANAKSNSKMLKELIGLADSFLNVKIGGVTYKASDLLDPDVGNKKINEHLNQLIGMSKNLPVEKTGFNFGEIQPGIYTDVQGTGPLQYRAKIANTTNKPFVYYPAEYVGQVGSPTKNGGVAYYAAADSTMRQRVTGGNPSRVEAQGEPKPEEPEEDEYEWVCRMGCKDGCKKAIAEKNKSLAAYLGVRADLYCLAHGIKLGWGVISEPLFNRLKSGKNAKAKVVRKKLNLDIRKTASKNAINAAEKIPGAVSATKTALTAQNEEAFRGEGALRTALGYTSAAGVPIVGYYDPGRDIGETIADIKSGEFDRKLNAYLDNIAREEWNDFWKKHQKIKKRKR